MNRLRWVLLAVVLAAAGLAGYHHDRNPERRALTAAVREHDGTPGAYVTLSDGVTHYEAAGPDDGRVAVLVHGFSVPSYIWDPTFAALRDAGYRVIRYDLFGRGMSDRPDAAYDGAFYDRQLDELLKALKVDGKIDLFGLSFGGYVTAHYTATHPQRVRTLNLVDPSNSAPTIPRRSSACSVNGGSAEIAARERRPSSAATNCFSNSTGTFGSVPMSRPCSSNMRGSAPEKSNETFGFSISTSGGLTPNALVSGNSS